MEHLTADKLLSIKRRIVPYEIPELGGRVFLRELSVGETEDCFVEDKNDPSLRNLSRSKYICYSLCYENGEPMFDQSKAAEVDNMVSRIGSDIFNHVSAITAMNAEDFKKKYPNALSGV